MLPRGALGFAIWLAAAAAAGALWWHTQGPREPFPGIAGGLPTVLGSAQAGRVAAVNVRPGDLVEAGAVLLALDAADLDAQVRVLAAALKAAEADVEAEALKLVQDQRLLDLDLSARASQARAAIDDVKARQSAAKGELRSLSTALGRLRGVAEAGLTRGDQVADLESRQARLKGEASFGPQALDAWRDLVSRIETDAPPAEAAERALAPFRARVAQAQREVEAVQALRAQCEVRAPHAGRVARVRVGPGAAVVPGVPLVELVGPEGGTYVEAWLPEDRARLLEVGSVVALVPRDRHGPTLSGRVERLGPALEALPERLWLDPGSPRFGRPILVRAEAPLLPGEAMQVLPR
jgi:multidrug resistance efflux pump